MTKFWKAKGSRKKKANPSTPISSDVWSIIFKYCHVKTLARCSRVNWSLNTMSKSNKYWKYHVFLRWPRFCFLHPNEMNYKSIYAKKHVQELDYKQLVFDLIEQGNNNDEQIEKLLHENHLDVMKPIAQAYDKIGNDLLDKMATIGFEMLGDSDVYFFAWVKSLGKQAYDAIMINPRLFFQTIANVGQQRYEEFDYIWADGEDCEHLGILCILRELNEKGMDKYVVQLE